MKDKIEFFKTYYENQHNRREKTYEQFSYFIGLLTVKIGFIGFYLLNFPTYKSEDSSLFYFFIFCILIVVGLIIKVFFIINSWTKNKTYAEFAKPKDIKKYIDELNESGDSDAWNNYILNEYVTISNHNITINEERHSLNMEIRRYLVYIIYALILSFVPYFFLMGNELNAQKVIILNTKIDTECEKKDVSNKAKSLATNIKANSVVIIEKCPKEFKKNFMQKANVKKQALNSFIKKQKKVTVFDDKKFIYYKL